MHPDIDVEDDLRRALHEGGLDILYQPICEATSRAVQGYEALLRWRKVDGSEVQPDVFIPVAERCGLIVLLGRRVLEAACAEAAGWPTNLGVSVNLSPHQFHDPDFPRQVAEILSRTGLSSSRLTLEVTEGVLIEDVREANQAMYALRCLGVTMSIDDFGSGFARLDYLRTLTFDALKLDKSLLAGVGSSSEAHRQATAALHALLEMSRALQLSVVAEGVEDEGQLRLLQDLGCDQVQGFLLGTPVTAARLRRLHKDHRVRPPSRIHEYS